MARAYLAGERWQRLRKQALQGAGYRCQVCNGFVNLEVHHRTYAHVGTTQERDDLVVLCAFCHALYHGKVIHRILRLFWRRVFGYAR